MDWKLELAARELYVLELVNGKFYVGQAKDSNRRIKKHFSGTGSQWTRLHPPVREVRRVDLGEVDYRAGELAENEAVLALMRIHGYQNVRGGFFTNLSHELTAKALISHGHRDVVDALPGVEAFNSVASAMAAGQPPCDVVGHTELDNGGEYSLFVLLLEGDRYFVGYSSNPVARIRRHFAGKGSEWTAMHKPVEVLSVRSLGMIAESEAARFAAKATVSLMRRVGWQHVRGGPWWSVDPEATLKLLVGRGVGDISPLSHDLSGRGSDGAAPS